MHQQKYEYPPETSENQKFESKRSKRAPLKCRSVGGSRICPAKVCMQSVVTRRRNEIVSDATGTNMFVMVALGMHTSRNNTKAFPNTGGGDIVREFEEARKPHMRSALNAKIENLEEKRKTENTKRKVRPSSKAPRSMPEARARTHFKE